MTIHEPIHGAPSRTTHPRPSGPSTPNGDFAGQAIHETIHATHNAGPSTLSPLSVGEGEQWPTRTAIQPDPSPLSICRDAAHAREDVSAAPVGGSGVSPSVSADAGQSAVVSSSQVSEGAAEATAGDGQSPLPRSAWHRAVALVAQETATELVDQILDNADAGEHQTEHGSQDDWRLVEYHQRAAQVHALLALSAGDA